MFPLQRLSSRLPQLLRLGQLHFLRCSLRSRRNRVQSDQLYRLGQHPNQHHLHSLHRRLLPFGLGLLGLLHIKLSLMQRVNRNSQVFELLSRLLPSGLCLRSLLHLNAQLPHLQLISRTSSVFDL